MDLDGKVIWRYSSSNKVYRVVHGPGGQFYVCTFVHGVRVLDTNGKLVSSLNDDISDILFVNPTTVLTISADNFQRQLEVRDETFQITKSFPLAKGAFRLIASDWPQTNALCYATYEDLICTDQDGKTTKQVSLGGPSTSVNGVIVRDDQGSSYLALMACHKTALARSRFLVINEGFSKVYEETLPPSLAVSTLGTSNRVYVGVGTKSVVEYQFEQKQ
jgi:hypothetical protein